MTVLVVRTMSDYPPGLIGTVAALFGRSISASHGVDWTLEVMVAEQQCEFFRRFRPDQDRVWVVMEDGIPRGALTIEGPMPEERREAARLRFFILNDSLRGRGLGRHLVAEAMQFCRERGYRRVYLTTLAGLDAARQLYEEQGFRLASESQEAFHGSGHTEQVLEWRDDSSMIRRCNRSDIAAMESIINEAAEAYRGVIPADCWHTPYMSRAHLESEISAGVEFWGRVDSGALVGVMGLQRVQDATLIRHAYVRPGFQGKGVGGALLKMLQGRSSGPLLVGTWAAAEWAIRFYEHHGFRMVTPLEKDRLLATYWTISARQAETSVVLEFVKV